MADLSDAGMGKNMLDKFKGKVFPREETIKTVVLGSPGVGKTALITRLLTNQFFNHYVPGKETAYKFTINVGPKKVKFDIMDSNGKNAGTISYADAVILVYSVTDSQSFDNVQNLIEKVRNLTLNNIPIVVIANKIDQTKKRQISKQCSEKLSNDYDINVYERSAAIPQHNIDSIFIELYKVVHSSKKLRRESDPKLPDPSARMTLRSIRRRSSSLDCNEFIKLVL